jgi:DNA-binding transcriptional LysR family regulator
MSDLDLTDLRILDELHRTGSISRTAEKVGLSQPSVSLRLGDLRRHFNDLLFVRTSRTMVPTHAGDRAVAAARQSLELLERAISPEDEFDPGTSRRSFRICMTSSGQLAILPKLLTRIKEEAPKVSIDVLDSTGEIERMLESGDADIAIGVRIGRQKGLIAQTLFHEHHVCLASKKHRRVGKSLTLQQFLAESHVETNLRSASMGLWMMDQAPGFHKLPRHVALTVPSLIGLSQIVANTELLAIVPYHVALALTKEDHVKALVLPVEMPSFSIVQYWHRRYNADPGNRWLRTTILGLFSNEARTRKALPTGSAKSGRRNRRQPSSGYSTVRAAATVKARRT